MQPRKIQYYFWCLHCERVFLKSSWVRKKWSCPSSDCDGDWIDAWPWDERFYEELGYEKNPVPGSSYPLYPRQPSP